MLRFYHEMDVSETNAPTRAANAHSPVRASNPPNSAKNDSNLGRWINPDPIVPQPGNPQTLIRNLHAPPAFADLLPDLAMDRTRFVRIV
jgi:hypothetical protein